MLDLIAKDEHEWLLQSVKERFRLHPRDLSMKTARIGGLYYRVTDPDWP